MTTSLARPADRGFAALGVRRSLAALAIGIVSGCLLFLSGYGLLALWSKLDGTSGQTCTQALFVSRAGEVSRGPLVLGHIDKGGTLRWSNDPKVLAAEHALENLQ